MSCTTCAAMPSILKLPNNLKLPKMPSTSRVIEHGLLVGIAVVLMNAAITLETLEIVTGMIGALAVCVMKENASRKCPKTCPDGVSGCKIASASNKNEPTTQVSFADAASPRDAEFVQLRACVQAELNVLRAECKLETWKNKADQAEVELVHVNGKIAELERELSQQDSTQPWIDQAPQMRLEDLFGELTEAKLRAEEVETELVQAHTNMAELENEIAQAALSQSRIEEAAQMRIDELSTDLTHANDQSATDVARTMLVSG